MIDQEFIDQVCAQIVDGKRVKKALPGNGELFFDRSLPFVCVYRYPPGNPDPGIRQLVQSQSAYLLISDEEGVHEPLADLVHCVSKTISAQIKSFLLIEIWPGDHAVENYQDVFKIMHTLEEPPASILTLAEGLNQLAQSYAGVTTDIINESFTHPPHLPALLTAQETYDTGCMTLGLEIPIIYSDRKSKQFYALLFRDLLSRFSTIIKQSVFEFSRVQTSDPFGHYLSLGSTYVDDTALEVDQALASISERFDFLLSVTPTNRASAWEQFSKAAFKEPPIFYYRPISVDPERLKRDLYQIPIQEIYDPTLAYLFRDKRLELDKQLSMLQERGSEHFLHTGITIYGRVPQRLQQKADALLQHIAQQESVSTQKVYIDADAFISLAQKEVDYYKSHFEELQIGIQKRADISGLMVSKCDLLISEEFRLPLKRAEPLIQHEVGTHILTYCNGQRQPIQQFYAGFAGYDALQEGLAVVSEYLVGGLTQARLKILAARVVAAASVYEGADFIETFRLLTDTYRYAPERAFNITSRVHRGGGLVKDMVYLQGIVQLLDYVEGGGKLELLYAGKFAQKHIPFVEELVYRNIIHTPILPPFLKTEKAQQNLSRLRQGIPLSELINS